MYYLNYYCLNIINNFISKLMTVLNFIQNHLLFNFHHHQNLQHYFYFKLFIMSYNNLIINLGFN